MLFTILFFVAIFALLCVLVKQAHGQRLVVIALAILVVCLPLHEHLKSWGMLISSMLIIVAFILNKSRQFTWQPIFYVIAGMYFLGFIGLLHTGDFNLAHRRFDVAIPMILFPVLFSMVQLSKRNVLLLLRFFLWIVFTVCMYGLLSYAIAISDFSWKTALLDGKRYVHLFTVWPITWQPSALSIMLLMALPVSFYLRYHDGKQITLIEMLLAILLPIFVAFIVGARIGVAVIPVLLGFGYLFYCKFRPLLKWGLVVAGVVLMSITLLLLPSEIKEGYTDQIRIDLRNTAISAIKEKPVFGWGTWTQRDLIACEERLQNLGIEIQHNQPHFHNLYLDMMVQFGIAGIVVLLWLVLWIFWIAIRERHFLLLSFIMMYVMVFYFEIVLYSPRWVVAFMFWFCILLANRKYLAEYTNKQNINEKQ
jgi:O-antigen ligase